MVRAAKRKRTEDDNDEQQCSAIKKSRVNKMPDMNDCYLYWVTPAAIQMRTLFDTMYQIVTDAIMVVNKNGIFIEREDETTSMLIIAKLDNIGCNGDKTFKCDMDMEIGISIPDFHQALNAGIKGDVLGLAVTRKSWKSGQCDIELHLMTECHVGYSYKYVIRSLYLQCAKVKLPKEVNIPMQLTIPSIHLKRILTDCVQQGEFVSFTSSYNEKTNLVEVVLRPEGRELNQMKLELTLYTAVHSDVNKTTFYEDEGQEAIQYSIASLQLFTKATA